MAIWCGLFLSCCCSWGSFFWKLRESPEALPSNIEGTVNIKWFIVDPLHPHTCSSPCRRNLHLKWSFVASLFIPASVPKQQLLYSLFSPALCDSLFCPPCTCVHPVCCSLSSWQFTCLHSGAAVKLHIMLPITVKWNKRTSKGESVTTVRN